MKVAASDRVVDKLTELEQLHPGIKSFPLDVTGSEAVKKAAGDIKAYFGAIDLAVLCAGVAHPMHAENYDAKLAVHSMDVNFNGNLRALGSLMPDMIQRRAGHIAMIASMTGYRGMTDSAAYAPSKAAIIALAESLKLDLQRYGVRMTVINPGFVDTPITQQLDYPLPYIMTARDAATRIIAGLKAGRYEIAFPWQMLLTTKLGRIMPNAMYFWFCRKIDEQGKAQT